MAFVLHHVTVITSLYIGGEGGDTNKQTKLNCVKINGSKSFAAAKLDLLRQDNHAIALPSIGRVEDDVDVLEEHFRQNIPTRKQLVDPYRQGLIVEEGVGYRQTVVIRSYEVGPDKTATIESLLNLLQVFLEIPRFLFLVFLRNGRSLNGFFFFFLQETALNHVWMSGLLGDGFGATHGMMRNNLIWVVSRMQVKVEHYPIW